MRHLKTSPSFLLNRFKEVTEPVTVKPDRKFPFFETLLVLIVTAIITVSLLTLFEIWCDPFFELNYPNTGIKGN